MSFFILFSFFLFFCPFFFGTFDERTQETLERERERDQQKETLFFQVICCVRVRVSLFDIFFLEYTYTSKTSKRRRRRRLCEDDDVSDDDVSDDGVFDVEEV